MAQTGKGKTASAEAPQPEVSSQDEPSTEAPRLDLQEMAVEAYRDYLQSAQQGQADILQRYAATLQRYAGESRAVEEETQKRLAESLARFQREAQEAMQRATAAQQAIVGLAQSGDAMGATGYQAHVDALQQAQRDQEKATQAFSSELSSLWARELPKRSQDVYAVFSKEMLALAAEVQRRGDESNRQYLRAVKEFWSRVDVDAVAGRGTVGGSV